MSTNWQKWFVAALAAAFAVTLISGPAVAKKPVKPPPEPPLQYVMTEVPFVVKGMNNVGDVVGLGLYLAETDAAYDLNLLFAGIAPEGATILLAGDINDPDPALGTRQIAGTFWDAEEYAFRGTIGIDADGEPFAMFFTPLPVAGQDYPPPADREVYTRVKGTEINNRGDVAGTLDIGEYDTEGYAILIRQYAILWPADGGIVQIDGVGAALDINDEQQVTGWMDTAAGETHAYRYTPGTPPVLLDIGGTRKRPISYGLGINNLGQVTGFVHGSQLSRVIRYTDGVGLEELGNFFKDPYSRNWGLAINSSGQVVGWAERQTDYVKAGFLYTDSDGFLDLATLISNPPAGLDGQSLHPIVINDFAGHIYGQILVETNLGGFVLTPSK